MPVTYASSIGSDLSITSGSADTEEPVDLVDQTHSVEAAMGDMSSGTTGGTAATGAIDAAAFGDDTLATVSADVSIVDESGAVVTSANIDAYAAAQSDDDSAFASTYIDFSYYGSGSYISIVEEQSYFSSSQEGTTSTSTSSLAVVVIDLEGGADGSDESPPPEEEVPPVEDPLDPGSSGGDQCECGNDEWDDGSLSLDGNLATFDATAFAAGTDSYSNLVVDAFALEDEMSTVTILIDAAIS